jgi:hypothetical protein
MFQIRFLGSVPLNNGSGSDARSVFNNFFYHIYKVTMDPGAQKHADPTGPDPQYLAFSWSYSMLCCGSGSGIREWATF